MTAQDAGWWIEQAVTRISTHIVWGWTSNPRSVASVSDWSSFSCSPLSDTFLTSGSGYSYTCNLAVKNQLCGSTHWTTATKFNSKCFVRTFYVMCFRRWWQTRIQQSNFRFGTWLESIVAPIAFVHIHNSYVNYIWQFLNLMWLWNDRKNRNRPAWISESCIPI